MMNKSEDEKQGQAKLKKSEPGQERPITVERVVSGLAGAAFEGLETVEGGVTALMNLNKAALRTAGKITEPLRKPLEALGVTDLVQRPVDAIAQSVEDRVNYLEEKGRAGLVQTGQLTIDAVGGTVDAVLTYLENHPKVDTLLGAQLERLLPLVANHPAVDDLVRKIVASILPQLKDDPAVQALVRAQAAAYLTELQTTLDSTLQALIRQQGDAYIEYLNAHPTAVQNLIQGQSVNLANEVLNEVREQTVTADTVAEMLVRRIFRRPQRGELPQPSPEVQRRAETARLPSDFFVAPDSTAGQGAKPLPPPIYPQLPPPATGQETASSPPNSPDSLTRGNGHA